jgi:F-type H+-transporting ATPase subunit b
MAITGRKRMTLGTTLKLKRMTFRRGLLRLSLLVMLGLSLSGTIGSLRAQEQPVPPQKQQADDAEKHQGLQQQLVRREREAAGEEKDDKAEFKQSPSVRFIARFTGLSTGNAYLLSVLLNFAVIAGLITWLGRKYLPGAFSARTEAIQKAMQEAQKAGEEARQRLAEIESRLMKLDVEIGTMRDTAEKEAGAEEARIQAAAQDDARKMVESAHQEISAAAKAARRELTAYAADLAVGLARKQIHVDAATDQALVRKFTGELGVSSDGPGKDGR